MPSTRTAPLRARAADASFESHPLSALHEPAAADRGRHDLEPAAAPMRRPIAGSAAGSLQSLDWRQAVGGALVVLGMLGIIIAWFGVSGTLDPGEQMPYISSGGFGGAALIAIGVTLLISFEHSRDRDALAQVLDELDELRERLDTRARQDGV